MGFKNGSSDGKGKAERCVLHAICKVKVVISPFDDITILVLSNARLQNMILKLSAAIESFFLFYARENARNSIKLDGICYEVNTKLDRVLEKFSIKLNGVFYFLA